jgi:hypothetical protein
VGPAAAYRTRWTRWGNDPLAAARGVSFDRTPSGPIHAPRGNVRVCAYHTDFDEHPVCWLDVGSIAEAAMICDNLVAACGWNIDFAIAFDEAGEQVAGGAPY